MLFLQAENTQVALTEESRSEGKIGFKAYKNYFRAGAHWFIIIVLILLNLAAQVSWGWVLYLRVVSYLFTWSLH